MNGTSSTCIENIYNLWKADPTQVHSSWDKYFKGIDTGRDDRTAYVSPPTLVTGHGRPLETGAPAESNVGIRSVFKVC